MKILQSHHGKDHPSFKPLAFHVHVFLTGIKYNVYELQKLARKKLMEQATYSQPFMDAIRAVFDPEVSELYCIKVLRDEVVAFVLKQNWKLSSSPAFKDIHDLMDELPSFKDSVLIALLREREQGISYGTHYGCVKCGGHRLMPLPVDASPFCEKCNKVMVFKETFHYESGPKVIRRPRY